MHVLAEPTRTSVVPRRTADLSAALDLYRTDGAVIVAGAGEDPSVLAHTLRAMFGDAVRSVGDAVEVRAAGGRDRPDLDAEGHLQPTPLHTDGFALADGAPDVLTLGCVHAAVDGGASFLADLDRVLEQLAAGDAEQRELAEFLVSVDIDQTEPGKLAAVGPIGLVMDGDRTAWRCSAFLRPTDDDPDPARTRTMVQRWQQLLIDLEPELTRFDLVDGDALVADNTRLVHGRDPYGDTRRLLWRLWGWTDRAVVPDTAYTGSDTSRVAAG